MIYEMVLNVYLFPEILSHVKQGQKRQGQIAGHGRCTLYSTISIILTHHNRSVSIYPQCKVREKNQGGSSNGSK